MSNPFDDNTAAHVTIKPGETAKWLALICLTLVNLLNYIDRYIFSALLPSIKADLNFTDTELGLLGSAFLFAYMFASPLFGWLGDRGGRSRIMSVGVGIWSVATAFSGVCRTFTGQFVTRAAVGFGESAYSVIAPSAIADHFTKESRGKVFAIYSGALPIGSALGYVIGGILESRIGWQRSFFVVGIPGLLLALLLFFLPDPKRGAAEDDLGDTSETAGRAANADHSIKTIYIQLMKNGGFVLSVLGYAAYTFVVGGMAFWMPSYLVRDFHVTLQDANIKFGTLTVVGGFVGVLLGGWWSDRVEKNSGNGFLKVSFFSMLVSIPLFFYALTLKDYNQFMIALFFLEVALFICISPLDAAVISYVRPAWRSSAMALNVLLIHILGDGISRTLMGVVSDQSGLHSAILMLPYALMVAALFWLAGFVFYWQAVHWPAGALKLPRWQAHRGFRPDANVVENTLAAFERAAGDGAVMTECDVQLSADGQAVIHHDASLERLSKRDDLVSELTAAKLQEYAGAPTLLQLLTDKKAPQLINIELKTKDKWTGKGLEEAVVRAVREAGAEGRVMVSSFNPFSLHRISKLAPQIPRALLATEEKDPLNKIYFRKMWLGAWARPHAINLDQDMITAARLEEWRDRGLRVAAWTVNDAAKARKLLDLGVVSIISDTLFTDERGGYKKA